MRAPKPANDKRHQRGMRLPPGLPARVVAVNVLEMVLDRGVALDEALAGTDQSHLSQRDRAFARLLVASVLRHAGALDAVIASFLAKPLPEDQRRLRQILRAAAAQLLLLDTKPHAAISLAVDHCRLEPRSRHFDRLANAVLRRVATEGSAILAARDGVRPNIPDWLWQRWSAHYGPHVAADIAATSLRPAPLDVTPRGDPIAWADRLGGILLATGTIRLEHTGRIDELAGYDEGAWWVQDAAAALPARLLGDVSGREVLDLCAAPGGKTAELAVAGARVTALDVSPSRLALLRDNFSRLRLTAELVEADAAVWAPNRTFDAVLLDAPCTATGTIRRHPDILHLKRETDVARLAEAQRRLIDNAIALVRPGGMLVYATCSLEPEEGERQVAALLDRQPAAERVPLQPPEYCALGLAAEWITPLGELRTLPFHTPAGAPQGSGMDGFYAARIRRRA